MTKAEIIGSLREQADTREWYAIQRHDSVSGQHAKDLREAAEMLQSVPEWISVKDGLPEDDGHYLCALTFEIIVINTWYEGKWVVNSEYVTHWMPLPRLPSENKGGRAK